MHPVISVLEEAGLVFPETFEESIRTMSDDELHRFAQNLEKVIQECGAQRQPTSLDTNPFNLLASASIRGDSGCIGCKPTKIEDLARYAVLYSEQLVLPVDLHLYCEIHHTNLRKNLSSVLTLANQGLSALKKDKEKTANHHLYFLLKAKRRSNELRDH